MIRDFLFGVGAAVSGVFCIAVNPPVGGRLGAGLVTTGFSFMWNAVNNMVVDAHEKQARLVELERLQKQLEEVAK